MKGSSQTAILNVVDLFCGCGGLSCGFDLHVGELKFQTVLGIDNHSAAISIFNANFPAQNSAKLPIGRLADMTWFMHPAEIRLYYLVQYAYSQVDDELKSALNGIGLVEFLSELRLCDEHFAEKTSLLSSSPEYREAISSIPSETFVLALPQAVIDSLSLSSVAKPLPDAKRLPWCEEYNSILKAETPAYVVPSPSDENLLQDSRRLLNKRLSQLREAATKTGTGQNRNNAGRLKALVDFFDTDPARELSNLWTEWHGERATIRAKFCLDNEPSIDALYAGPRRVHVVLGGPPCKGFSRIGRPVIQALRDQGVHAWSHREFGDERNSLMCQYVLFLGALKPDLFLFENVSNFQSVLKTPGGQLDAPAMLEELIGELSEGHIQYHIHHRLVNARHFAIPQDRRRFIMVGVHAQKAEFDACLRFFAFDSPDEDVPLKFALMGLGEPAVFQSADGVRTDHRSPVFRFFDDQLPKAARKYLSWVQQADPLTNKFPLSTTAHIYRESRPDDRAFIEFVAPGIRWMDLKVPRSRTVSQIRAILEAAMLEVAEPLRGRVQELLNKVDDSLMLRLLLEHTQEMHKLPEQHLLLETYLKNGGAAHGDWLERLSPNKPCKTIVAHIGKDTYGYWHPTEARALTIREAARVQSFPDCFRFDMVGVVDTYSAIGNAVPPLLGAEFAKRVEEIHSKWIVFSDQPVYELAVAGQHMHARQLELAIPG
jgi:DNA-cytosine methyltransferase